MKTTIHLSLLASILLLVVACTKPVLTPTVEFSLGFKKSAFISIDGTKHKIEYIERVDDSICPEGANCYWQGQVIVKIRIDDSEERLLGILAIDAPNSTQFKGHTISLKEISYSKSNRLDKRPKHSKIKLRVE
jgi:hypothetical protein